MIIITIDKEGHERQIKITSVLQHQAMVLVMVLVVVLAAR